MEAYGLRHLIAMIQNLVIKRLTEAGGGYGHIDNYLIDEMYSFYMNSHGSRSPSFLYIDPFTFNQCFGSDHPDIMFQGDNFWYKGGVIVKFNPYFFGFFNTQPS